MAQSVVIGLLCSVRVRNDPPIVIVPPIEHSIENINICYLSYLQVVIQWSQLVQINWVLNHLSRASVCECHDEPTPLPPPPEIREAVISKMTRMRKILGLFEYSKWYNSFPLKCFRLQIMCSGNSIVQETTQKCLYQSIICHCNHNLCERE